MSSRDIKLKLNLKTGFFKTEPYFLVFQKNTLKLLPTIDNKTYKESIVINTSNIKSISVSNRAPFEIEIITDGSRYTGIFKEVEDISVILKAFKAIKWRDFSITNF